MTLRTLGSTEEATWTLIPNKSLQQQKKKQNLMGALERNIKDKEYYLFILHQRDQ